MSWLNEAAVPYKHDRQDMAAYVDRFRPNRQNYYLAFRRYFHNCMARLANYRFVNE